MPATFAFYQLWLLTISIADIADEDTFSDFGDLGKQLLGGFVIAVVVAVVYTLIKLRLRDQKPPAQFISIGSFKGTDEVTKAPSE
jgi:hypothetical protein